MRYSIALAVFAMWGLLLGSDARADIIPVFNAVTPLGGDTEFSYTVSIAAGSRVNKGDYFTIYDFDGYIAGSDFAPVDWSFSVQNIGITPAGQIVSDSPGIQNLTFTYTGFATLFGPISNVGGIGAFGADSTFSAAFKNGQYASQSHILDPGNPDDNTVRSDSGKTVIPFGSFGAEPSSIVLLLPGLLPLGIMLRRRGRS